MQKNLAKNAFMIVLSALSFSTLRAQNTSFNLDVLPLWHPETGPYVDILCYVQSPANTQTQVAAWLQKGVNVAAADKISISAPPSKPEAAADVPMSYQSMLRLAADTGLYDLYVAVGPDPEHWDTLRGSLRLTAGNQAQLAPVLLAEHVGIANADQPEFSRYGLEVRPLVHWGDHVFTSANDKLRFYSEAYRVPQGKKAVLTYALRSAERGDLRADLGGRIKI